jgi:hypothetical protein
MKKYLVHAPRGRVPRGRRRHHVARCGPPVQQEDMQRGDQRLHRLPVCGVIGEGLQSVQESVYDGGHGGMSAGSDRLHSVPVGRVPRLARGVSDRHAGRAGRMDGGGELGACGRLRPSGGIALIAPPAMRRRRAQVSSRFKRANSPSPLPHPHRRASATCGCVARSARLGRGKVREDRAYIPSSAPGTRRARRSPARRQHEDHVPVRVERATRSPRSEVTAPPTRAIRPCRTCRSCPR